MAFFMRFIIQYLKGKVMKALLLKLLRTKKGKAALLALSVGLLDIVGMTVSPEWQSIFGLLIDAALLVAE